MMSKGNAPKERTKLLVKALLEYEGIQEDKPIKDLRVTWLKKVDQDLIQKEIDPILEIKAIKQALFYLLKDIPGFKPSARTSDKRLRQLIGEVLIEDLGKKFLNILDDQRKEDDKAAGEWKFTLKLWDRNDIPRNLQELDDLWESKRLLKSGAHAANANIINNKGVIEEGGLESPAAAVAPPMRENVRLRGFNDIGLVPVWEGREVLLGELGQKLRDGLRVLAITGQGGIGKSSLASKLMEALGIGLQPPSLGADCHYSGVVYFRVQVGMSFDYGAGQLLRDLGEEQGLDLVKPEEKIDKIITYLIGQKWLLVLDNLEDILHPGSHEAAGRAVSPEWGQLLNALVYKTHCSQMIITSRELPVDLGELRGKSYRFNSKLVKTFSLEGIEETAAVKVLEDYEMQDSRADLVWMADRTKGHPLILELLGNYADQPGYLRQHPELITGEAKPVLQNQLARLDEAGRDLLKRMCVLRVPIDVQGLTFLRLYTDDRSKDARFERAAIRGKPAELTPAEIAETREMMEKLVASSLVRRNYNTQKQEQFYELHRVIADFLQEEYAEESPELLKRVYRFYCTGKGVENPKTLADLQPILEAQHFAFQIGSYDEAYNLLQDNLKYHLYNWGNWALLRKLFENSLLNLQDKNVHSHILLEIIRIDIDLGRWNEAEIQLNEIMALLCDEKTLAANFSISSALEMLGEIARNQGKLDKAKSFYKQSLEIRIKLHSHNEIASNWASLGSIATLQGNWDEAERFYHQCLEVVRKLGDRSGMASTWGCLGENELGKGNLDQAEKFLTEALADMEKLGMTWHIGETNYDLAQLWRKRGNLDLAQQYYTTATTLFQNLGAAKDLERIQQEWSIPPSPP